MFLLHALAALLCVANGFALTLNSPPLSDKSIALSFSQHLVDGPSASFLRRQHGLRQRANSGLAVPLYDAQSHMLYIMNITIGSPPQPISLQIDTGSSDLWLPYSASTICSRSRLCSYGSYNPKTSSSLDQLKMPQFQISYVDGTQIQGEYIGETVGLGSINVKNQTMAVATDAIVNCNTCPFQGIIGIGYSTGESIVFTNGLGAEYPNIVTELKSQGFINTKSYSLWLNDLGSSSGNILFGAIDRRKFSGDLVSLAVIPDAGLPDGVYLSFTVILDSLWIESRTGKSVYSSQNLSMPVVLDSGTSLTYLEDQLANDIDTGVGVVNHPDLGKIVSCALGNTDATFSFRFGGSTGPTIKVPIRQFVLPFPSGYNIPACQWGIYNSGEDPNLFGDTFLRSAYVVYDLENNKIALAQTVWNTTESDIVVIQSTIPGVTIDIPAPSTTIPVQTSTGQVHTPTAGTVTGAVGLPSSSVTGTFDLGQKTGAASSVMNVYVYQSLALGFVVASAGSALILHLLAF